MADAGFSKTDRVKVCTAANEIAQNAVRHGGGGQAEVKIFDQDRAILINIVVSDCGPGIADLERAMTPGFSTGGTLGLGLSGAKDLVDDFTIASSVGKGTRVTIMKSGKIKN